MRLLKYLLQYRFKDMAELLENEKVVVSEYDFSLEGKTVVLSGATSGIGLETALLFAEKGADLICLNRDPAKSENLKKKIKENYNKDIQNIIVDFSSFEDVKKCASFLLKMEKNIDVLIHNAGVFHTRKTLSQDNMEMVFQVNHLSSFMLNILLTKKLEKENRARILYVNSEGHRFALAGVHLNDLHWKRHFYSGLKSYGAAKTAQLLTMCEFDKRFKDSSVCINAMHPGNVRSNMGDNNGRLYRKIKEKLILKNAKDPRLSAHALLYLSASEEMKGVSGQFFNMTNREKPAPHARDTGRVKKVWNKSLELCGLDP